MNFLKKKLQYGGEFNAAEFVEPANGLGPIYAWIWNAPATQETILRQLDEMVYSGVRVVYILPEPKEFLPDDMVTEMEPPYLSPEFMEMVRFTMEEAEKRGIAMWLYDEGGWPSGGAAGRVVARLPESRKKILDRRRISGEKAATLREQAYVGLADAEGNCLTQEEAAEKEWVWLYEIKDIYDPAAQPDVTDAEAIRLFVEITHEKYAAYGGEYVGDLAQLMFTDEPETAMPAWPRGFAEKFLERFGYDIRDHLACLFEEDSQDPARLDYVTLLEDLLREHFFDYQRRWCNDHGLLYGGHIDVEHTFRKSVGARCCDQLYLLRGMSVPGVDAIWRQIFPYPQGHNVSDECSKYLFSPLPIPEDLGKPDDTMIPFYPRLASSAAAQNGNNLALVEAMGVYGSGLTVAQMQFILGYLAARGINLFNFIAVSLGRNKYHIFGELPYFSPDMPAWKSMPVFNKWVSRLSYAMVLGERSADTALIYPVTEAALDGNARQQALRAYIEAGVALEKQGIDFDIINVRGILEGSIQDGCLYLGKGRYSNIVAPEGIRLPEEVKQRLAQLKGESRPVAASSNGFENLRLQRRICRNGDEILLAFNEGRASLETVLGVEGQMSVYRLDLATGETCTACAAAACGKTDIPLTIQSGETQVLLLTRRELPVRREPGQETETVCWQLQDFEQAVVRSIILDREGIRQEYPETEFSPVGSGDWNRDFGEAFSGEVAYRVHLRRESAAQGIAVLEAEGIRYTARVQVNGEEVGHLLAQPYRCRFDASLLKEGDNELVITVANTLANQYVFSGADSYWEEKELSPYHQMEMQMHKDSVPSGFTGPVRLRIHE